MAMREIVRFKRCPTCCEPDQTLRASAFYSAASRADGLSSQCRDCHHGVQRRYYARNAASERLRTRGRKTRVRADNRARVLQHLLTHPCIDCGESNPIVLEFHHVRGKKRDAVAYLVRSHEWRTVAAEIAKCEVLCANCHRIRTACDGGHFRSASGKRGDRAPKSSSQAKTPGPTVIEPPAM
jgi:hypothetical protein